MPTARANGITIYYEMHGADDPLVLIGGVSSDITLLRELIPRLAQRHNVIAYDNRGAGRSDKPDVPYTIAMLADDAAGLLEALGVGRADVAGISMGGKVALELALAHPDLVGHLDRAYTTPAPAAGLRLRAAEPSQRPV